VDTIIELLNSVKIIGPLGVVAVIEAWAIYSLFNKLEEIQEKRLQDWQQMKDEYTQLSSDINKTLDVLIKTLGRKNGNGNGGCNG
jgi:predicted PurR-regulated permease PerM